jgi:hypothetical protein
LSCDLLPSLSQGASTFPPRYSLTASARGAFCGSFSLSVLQVPTSSTGLDPIPSRVVTEVSMSRPFGYPTSGALSGKALGSGWSLPTFRRRTGTEGNIYVPPLIPSLSEGDFPAVKLKTGPYSKFFEDQIGHHLSDSLADLRIFRSRRRDIRF